MALTNSSRLARHSPPMRGIEGTWSGRCTSWRQISQGPRTDFGHPRKSELGIVGILRTLDETERDCCLKRALGKRAPRIRRHEKNTRWDKRRELQRSQRWQGEGTRTGCKNSRSKKEKRNTQHSKRSEREKDWNNLSNDRWNGKQA